MKLEALKSIDSIGNSTKKLLDNLDAYIERLSEIDPLGCNGVKIALRYVESKAEKGDAEHLLDELEAVAEDVLSIVGE